jgi:hypothetical protein
VLVVASALAVLVAAPARAATLTVTATTDSIAADGACTLREAVAAADAPGTPSDCGPASADANTIVLGPHTYTLSIAPVFTPPGNDDVHTGDLNVTAGGGALTIAGAGAGVTTISATTLGDRLFDIAAGANVAIRDLKLTGGHAPDGATGQQTFSGPGEPGGAGGNGGAISNAGTLAVTDATIISNVAGHGGDGGTFQSIANNSNPGGTGGSGGAGGGIYNGNTGTLTLNGVTLAQNVAGTGGTGGKGEDGGSGPAGVGGNGGCCGDGGGVANAGGTVVVSASTISANHAGDGGNGGQGGPDTGAVAGAAGSGAGGSSGGGISSVGGSISITNSTLSSNVTGVGGNGGLGGNGAAPGVKGGAGGGAGFGSAGGGVRVTSAPGALVNVTVYANQVGGPGTPGAGGNGSTVGAGGAAGQPAFAGGVYDTGLPATILTGTLLAANQLGNCGGVTLDDGGHNLSFGDASCPLTFATGDPRLGVLADNGGPTQTFALGPGSAAIDKIPATGAGCPATDQRGAPRPGGVSCDIGAYEIAPPSANATAATDLTATSATINGSATANDASATTDFEYGLTTAYGSQTTVAPIGGAGPVALSAPLTGLTPQTTYHYRLVATSADGTTASLDATFTTPSIPPASIPPPSITTPPLSAKPKLTHLKIAPSAFLAAPATHHRKTGTTITYTDSAAAKTTFVVLHAVVGVKHGSGCVKKPKHGHGKACTRYVKVGSFSHTDTAAANKLHFTGQVGGHKLARGRYRLAATPKLGTTAGTTVTVSFRVE